MFCSFYALLCALQESHLLKRRIVKVTSSALMAGKCPSRPDVMDSMTAKTLATNRDVVSELKLTIHTVAP